jgi:hypothetical protein
VDAHGEVVAYLRRRIPELLGLSVHLVSALSANVWRVQVEGGRELVAKYQIFGPLSQGKAYDLLEVERDVLAVLCAAGCPVPRLLAIDAEAFFVFFESVGRETLDDWVQEKRGDTAPLLEQIVRGQCAIDATLTQHGHLFEPRVAPGVDRQALVGAWHEVGKRAQWAAQALRRHLRMGPLPATAHAALVAMNVYLAQRCPVLGSSDYNARNIVITGAEPTASFIEFAKLGWDWTERRLVQYTTSMGSGREGALMLSLLDERAVCLYAEVSGRVDSIRALDCHHVFFMLNGAAALCEALEQPEREWAQALLASWAKPSERLRLFAKELAKPLSADGDAVVLRAAFQGM